MASLLTDVANNNFPVPQVAATGASVTQENNNNNEPSITEHRPQCSKPIEPSNAIGCVCSCDDEQARNGNVTGETRTDCDRCSRGLAPPPPSLTNWLYEGLDLGGRLPRDRDDNEVKQCLGHRRTGSATVAGHKSSIKSHRRTVSSITTTTFNCPHRRSSTVVVILGGVGRKSIDDATPKDCTQIVMEHCKVCQTFLHTYILIYRNLGFTSCWKQTKSSLIAFQG